MIFKTFILVCTVVWVWSSGARCEKDAPSGSEKTNVVDASKAGLQPVKGRKVDINQVKPTVKKAGMSGKDYQKNHTKPGRPGPNLVKSSLNVNVNHGGYSDPRWYNLRPHRYGRFQGFRHRKKHRLLQLIDQLPISNIDYNVMHPNGDVYIHRKKYPTRKAGNNLEGFGSDHFVSIEGGVTECYPVLLNTLKYLQRVDINLHNVEQKLKLLLQRFTKTNSNENDV